jgi:hypothetical protein
VLCSSDIKGRVQRANEKHRSFVGACDVAFERSGTQFELSPIPRKLQRTVAMNMVRFVKRGKGFLGNVLNNKQSYKTLKPS